MTEKETKAFEEITTAAGFSEEQIATLKLFRNNCVNYAGNFEITPGQALRIFETLKDRQTIQRQGSQGQQGGSHYAAKIDPWELQRVMKSTGNAFLDARRADVIKYAWRMKGNIEKLKEDLQKAVHCLQAAIEEIDRTMIDRATKPS